MKIACYLLPCHTVSLRIGRVPDAPSGRPVALFIPVRAERAPRVEAASLYAGSLVSFNFSLNGDLNMRVFEVRSAGGFLLTDRLSPQAGLDLLFRSGQDCETYADADEAMDKLAFYRGRPEAALRIAVVFADFERISKNGRS